MTPVLRYRNPGAAARWLCEAFGFQEHESAQESDRHVKYILLRLADSCVLVRPVSSSVFDDLMVEPSAVSGGNTHVLYLPVADAELHCARAQAAGAKVELEPQDDGLGGRFYTCRDPEGHLWSFGTKTYGAMSPARSALAPVEAVPAVARPRDSRGRGRASLIARASAGLTLIAALSVGWLLYEAYTQGAFEAGSAVTTGAVDHGAGDQLAAEAARRSADHPANDSAAPLAEANSRRRAAEAAVAEAGAKLSEEQALRAAAESRFAVAEAKLAELSAGALQARQAAQSQETDAVSERREAKEALAALEQRLAEQMAANARDKDSAANALSRAEQALREEKGLSARAAADREAAEAEAGRERARAAAAALAAGAEAAAARHDLAQVEAQQARQANELEAAYATLKTMRGEVEALRAAQRQAKPEPSTEPAPEVAATPRQQLAQLEAERAKQGAELEAAYTALNAIRGEIEATRAALREAKSDTRGEGSAQVAAAEPRQVATAAAPAAAPPRPSTPCAQAVQGKIRLAPKGSREWPEGSLARLCHGAETSLEPARCYDELMRGKISWGTGSTWTMPNALILCAGTKNARQTLDCFATSIAANDTWAAAISTCRSAKP